MGVTLPGTHDSPGLAGRWNWDGLRDSGLSVLTPVSGALHWVSHSRPSTDTPRPKRSDSQRHPETCLSVLTPVTFVPTLKEPTPLASRK